ncbi:S1 family peptidase [Vibrio vulnificus]|nr:S1 family peptidase [Vibrio vulnificus]HDY7719100.1 trypsin-like serine protease [Vibrio vulnificus]HDY7746450.1 trypsin-like serine protease [Vibrio vulnificus]HDY7756045.1 trypsin-like serine protease [Vibrio vulnificus]HDY7760462.1 trypsin-like serine protease [Vibrio vulnificus]
MKNNIKKGRAVLPLCALFVSIPSQAVSFGKEISAKEHPYLAFIDSQCTGTLIAPYTVLTAEHCVEHAKKVHLLKSSPFSDSSGSSGIEIDIVNVYKPEHIWSPNGNFDKDSFDDIAILEIASMPEGVTWLEVSSERIPEGSHFQAIGYGYAFGASDIDENNISIRGILRKGIENSTVATTTQCDDYYREAVMRKCEQHPQYSNQLFSGQYPQETTEFCEAEYNGVLGPQSTEYKYVPNSGHSICVDNRNVEDHLITNKRRQLADDFGNKINFVSVCNGDSGGPLIYNGKLYGVASIIADANCDTNPVSSYAGLTRAGIFPWIVDTVKLIQSKHQPRSQNNRLIIFPN